jgi:hypothetical protein
MTEDSSACFSARFITEFDRAVTALPPGHCVVTWANSEKGRVAAMLGPVRSAFIVAVEEGSVWLIDRQASEKLEVGPIDAVTGQMVVTLVQTALTRQGDPA